MADVSEQSPRNWDENQVSTWLKSIGVKEQYIEKLHEEEVDGPSLLALDENFLKTKICMKSGPAHLIIQKRDELLNTLKKTQDNKKPVRSKETELEPKNVKLKTDQSEGDQNVCEDKKATQEQCSSKEDCRARPFDQDGVDFIYETHRVLQPESGAFDLISPCHEFKSFALAATLDCTRLQAKFAKEVLKFATGCINIRSNGTIHFGVMDSKEEREGCRYVHGEIIGIPVNEKDIYVDALDHIEKSVSSDAEDVRRCVRPPRFIEVLDRDSTEKRYVVEVDIVPLISIVRGKVYDVCLPNFKESTNKVEREKKTIFRRVGSKTEPVADKDLNDFYQRVKDRDAQREEAEQKQVLRTPEICQDLGRKLKMLITSGKKCIEKEKWFILVTNRFQPDDLSSIDWLLNMNLFCVFDFDPDSKVSGLCSKYLEHRAANMHYLQSYRISSDTSIKEFTTDLHLFDQTSWIFCNGRSEYKGNEPPCDEMTWIKTKMSILRECVSLICKQILPPGTFQVIFLLTSPVEKPVLHTFNAFFADMEGHENIISFCESQTNFQKWQTFAEGTCEKEAVNNFSVVGMKMSHMNATLQQIQPVKACVRKYLPVFMKGTCFLEMHKEEQMYTLEIVTADHCDETSSEFIDENKSDIERQFYHGGRVTWLNFWLAENKYVGEVIERDAYNEVSKLLNDALKYNAEQISVHIINIYHHPGSGGSTVARQVLWNNRKDLRCAVVKASYKPADVARHAVEFREYEEKDAHSCVPVLLLIEDLDGEYLDDLKYELQEAINMKKIPYETLCFILLSCRRSHDPEKKCKESPLRNVAVTHKLSEKEKTKFAGKQQVLEQQYEPQFILTFVLMSKEFSVDYVQQFVTHVLQGIDHQSVGTRLIKYVALLNTYVQNSFISRSHCEAFLTLPIRVTMFREQAFQNALSDQANVVFLHLRDEQTHIDSIRIIHPLVAKEILKQLLGDQETQSSLANDLLCEDALIEHRFGRGEYLSFLRALFIRRAKKSKGDEYDSLFSPLIEHVRDREGPDKAIELLKEAFKRFHENQFFAQQLARLHYTYEKFEDAKYWAEEAVTRQPNNSYLLDTKGQVYRKWFQAKCKAIDKVPKTAENTADAVGTAIKALECFQECERAADTEMDAVNSSGYFSEVEVGYSLLKLISSLQVFANRDSGHAERMKYLVTDYIPAEVKDAWEPFHCRLKELHKSMQDALEWISEDLSLFQTDIVDQDETHTCTGTEEMMGQPLKWFAKKYSDYGKYFSEAESSALHRGQLSLANLTPFQKRMIICHYGGGNITAILSKLMEQKNAADVLEKILCFYPTNPIKAKFTQKDIVNYIMTNIALNNLSPQSKKLARLKDVQALCRQFPADKRKCSPSALFLLTVLFWPEDHDTDLEKETKYQTVQSTVEHLEKRYRTKLKDIPQRKRRLYTHFFLGRGNGLDKFVHKKKFESLTKGFSVSEKRLKWFSGEAWKKPEIDAMLKPVSGWTEDRVVYLEGPKKKRFSILPLNVSSVPDNENITFYLGFTFRGPVACNITITK